jgi:hypothetical protein
MTESPASTPLRVPSRTTPTWEVELLISGALVFSLFQLIPPLEVAFVKWIASVPANREPVVIYSFVYGKLVLFTLIGTFVLHIAARAGWVALVGVHTIYPQGPRWENWSGGPLSRKVLAELCGRMEDAVERADNRATLIFGYGVLAAYFSMVILVMTLVAVLLALLLEYVIDERWSLAVAASLVFLPFMLIGIADRYLGGRLRENGAAARWLERALRFSMRFNISRFMQPLLPLVTTNIGGRRGNMVLVAVFMAIMLIMLIDSAARNDTLPLLRGSALPAPSRSSGVHSLHYADARSELERPAAAPYIPSEVVEGPYLRLFVPYAANRHDQALRQQCAPALERVQRAADQPTPKEPAELRVLDAEQIAAEKSLMACFAELLALRLDGAPLPGLVLERHRDSFSGQDGGLAMIDVRALPAGRHELEIQRLSRASNGLRHASGPPLPPDRIVFWR